MDQDIVGWIEHWYRVHCNGDWEHGQGVKIETLDNPGWWVSIDLEGTDMSDKPFEPVETGRGENPDDWMSCRVQKGVFQGSGGPEKLGAILRVFKEWCDRFPGWDAPLSPEHVELVAARERIEAVRRALGREDGPEQCRETDCTHLRVAHSIFCSDHHIANLQRVGALPVLSDDGSRVAYHTGE